MANTGIGNLPSAGGGSANIPKALQEQQSHSLPLLFGLLALHRRWQGQDELRDITQDMGFQDVLQNIPQDMGSQDVLRDLTQDMGLQDVLQDMGFQDLLQNIAQDMGLQDVTFPRIWDFRMCSRIILRIRGFRCLGCESSDVRHRWAAPTLQDKPSSHGPYPHTSYGLGVFEDTNQNLPSLVLSRRAGLLDSPQTGGTLPPVLKTWRSSAAHSTHT